MGKNSPSFVLKKVFKDVSEIENIIKDSKKIEHSYDNVNFKDDKEVEKLIENTKTIVNTLKIKVTKIDDYFHDNYKTWKDENVTVTNGVDSSNNTNASVNEEALENDLTIENVDGKKGGSVEETEAESKSVSKNNLDKTKKMKKKKKKSESTKQDAGEKEIGEPQAATENDANSEKHETEAEHDNVIDTNRQADAIEKKSESTKQDAGEKEIGEPQAATEKDANSEKHETETEHDNVIDTNPQADAIEKKSESTEQDAGEKKIGEPQGATEKDANSEKHETEAEHDNVIDTNPQADAIEKTNRDTPVEKITRDTPIEKTNTDTPAETETTLKENTADTPSSETEIAAKSEGTAEQKIFLKCVDIKKLINPAILPRLKSPPPTRKRDSVNDSVLIISDSEEDTLSITKTQVKKGNKYKSAGAKKLDKNSKHKESLDQNSSNRSKRQTRNQKSLKEDSDVTVISDTDSKETKCLKKTNKKIEAESTSDSDSESTTGKRPKHNKSKMQSRRTRNKKGVNKTLSDTSSFSESEVTSKSKKLDQSNSKKSKQTKVVKHGETEKLTLDPKTDKKFSCEAYVSLPRIPCEKLKEHYLKENEIAEVQRLTNLNSLKRQRSNRPMEKKDHRSSSDTENVKPKSKRKRTAPKNSDSSDGNLSDEEPFDENSKANSKPESENIEIDQDAIKMILDDIKSGSDASTHESETDGENEKKKKTKKGDDDKKSAKDKESEKKEEKPEASTSDGKKGKSKWREDKLLTAKISDSDSEDEFIKFKKRSEKLKQVAKTRMCRKKLKNVIDSDSDSEKGNEKKNKSDDDFKPQKSSSSESDSDKEKSEKEEEEEKDPEKKKRRRIKRLKDSSSDEENKSTRKTIRRVIAHDSLAEATKRAEKDERERKARIAERQKKYNEIFDSDKPEDATVDKVVLDFNEETKEEILAVHKDLAKKLKPHQVVGVHYMWDACYESVERAKKTNGSGCILAHCMGLGKTLQVITLVHTLLTNEELTGVQRVLVVCPVNTVLNWVAEFSKWLDDIDGPEIDIYDLVSNKQNSERKYQVQEWIKDGGVLVMGYDMFRNLTNPTNKRLKKSERETFHKGLVNPGADLIVCDEGHLLKNEKSNLSIAMNRIHTVRRIVLTGTPMQNNLKEYYCMVQFVKPNLLGTYKEYLNRFVNPITNGQYTDSTQHDINIMRKRSHVLHKMLDGVVQRKDYSVLTPYLPPKYEYVLFLTLTEVQIKLYRHYLEEQSRRPVDTKMRTTFLFMDFQEFQRICTHPRVLLLKSQEKAKKAMFDDEDSEGSLRDFIDDNESEAVSTSSGSNSDASASDKSIKSKEDKKKGRHAPAQRVTRNSAAVLGIDVEEEAEVAVQANEWWGQFCKGDELENIALGSKLHLLFEILQQCELIGDKLLVFSQSLYSLNIIEYFLAKIDEATQKGDSENVGGFSGSWALGLDYFRLDGSSSCDNRSAWCKSFNNPDNPRARLFLISTKAGGLGINLIGANRVIIFDVSWNPSHDVQSIYRIYRFGQTKPCYIYRFVTNGTMEMKIYERQVTKQAISKRVIDEQQIDRHYNQTDLAELYNFDPKPDNQPTPLIPKDVLLAELLQKEKDRIFTYHEHQSLLENKEEEELNEAERKAAWEEFESEKTARVTANTAGGWIKNIPITSVTAALVNIVQKDNPTWNREQVQGVVPLIVQQLKEQVDKGEMLLFTRIVNELKLMQATQQQRLQEYYMQQQLRLLQQRFAQQQHNGGPSTGFDIGNALRTALNDQSAPTVSNEIVELND